MDSNSNSPASSKMDQTVFKAANLHAALDPPPDVSARKTLYDEEGNFSKEYSCNEE